MPLINMKDLLTHAYRHGYAVGAFDLVSLDFIEAIVQGAENRRAPVILSLAESHFEYFNFELAMAATVVAARRARVPVAIHLDHGRSLDSAVRAINLGCNGVMVDVSTLAPAANISVTRAVVETAHGCGVPVEGELGDVAGVEAEDAEQHPGKLLYTSPEQARAYVSQTGVDFLALRGRMQAAPRLDLKRLQRINEAAGVPLVMHSDTGITNDQYQNLIARGVAKINYHTALAEAAAQSMRANAGRDTRAGYADLLRESRASLRAEVERVITLWGGAGRAEEVLKAAKPWREVEHCIVYNTNKILRDEELEQMMAHGRTSLSAIPGVRRVFTGRARRDDAKYRYCWLVRFASSAVVASYRDHPDHVAFADTQFRPHAADRISIDFESIE